MNREKDVEKYLREKIEGLGGMFLKFTSPGTDGVPDRIAIFPDGRLVFVELKTETGKLSPVQGYICKKLIDLDQQVCIVYGRRAAEEFMRDMRGYSVSSWIYGPEGDYEFS